MFSGFCGRRAAKTVSTDVSVPVLIEATIQFYYAQYTFVIIISSG